MEGDNWLELHESWIPEIRKRINFGYENWINFSIQNQIDSRSVMHFKNGNPVGPAIFKRICEVLDFDWEKVQNH
jgi:hypothetical protein